MGECSSFAHHSVLTTGLLRSTAPLVARVQQAAANYRAEDLSFRGEADQFLRSKCRPLLR